MQVQVPAAWPVVDGNHTAFCTGPFVSTPTVFLGPQLGASPSCGASLGASRVRMDGVWLAPGSAPADATRQTLASGEQVLVEKPQPGETLPVEFMWFHNVQVTIGRGPQPGPAAQILASLTYRAQAPDTPTAQTCALSSGPHKMPTPERLRQPLVLQSGEITLGAVRPSDQAGVSAASIWDETGISGTLQSYRILLTRYSARFPARDNGDGSTTPLNHDVLAWVVYTAPLSATIPGCGSWGVTVFDARTGASLGGSDWSRGP